MSLPNVLPRSSYNILYLSKEHYNLPTSARPRNPGNILYTIFSRNLHYSIHRHIPLILPFIYFSYLSILLITNPFNCISWRNYCNGLTLWLTLISIYSYTTLICFLHWSESWGSFKNRNLIISPLLNTFAWFLSVLNLDNRTLRFYMVKLQHHLLTLWALTASLQGIFLAPLS